LAQTEVETKGQLTRAFAIAH